MIPTGETKPLEEQKAPAWQALWNAHKEFTKTAIDAEIEDLKKSAVEIKEVKKEATVSSKKRTSKEW